MFQDPYLPDGCTQADIDRYYGYDRPDPDDEPDPGEEPTPGEEDINPTTHPGPRDVVTEIPDETCPF